jgi:hypothetical protein
MKFDHLLVCVTSRPQINEAGRRLASKLGFHLVDLEAMAAAYGEPDDYLEVKVCRRF